MLWSDEVNKARITRRRKEQDEEAGGSCAAGAAAAAKLCLLYKAQQSSAVQCSAVVVLESCYCPSVQDHKKASCPINIQWSRERNERKEIRYLFTYLPTCPPTYLPTNHSDTFKAGS
jgi:hypothetical protein